MSQQTIVAVAIALVVVAVILVIVLLWPLGRLPWHDERQAVALAFGRGLRPVHMPRKVARPGFFLPRIPYKRRILVLGFLGFDVILK